MWLDDGPEQRSLFALGAGTQIGDASPKRFERMRQRCSQLFESLNTATVGDATLEEARATPAALVAFAFADAASTPDRLWRGWPAAWLYVPETLVSLASDGSAMVSVQHLEGAIDSSKHALQPGDETIAAHARERYLDIVRSSVNDIVAGRLDKVVLARSALVQAPHASSFDALASARAMRSAHPASIGYFIDRGRQGALIGATPETLVRVRGGKLMTAALAGTAPAGSGAMLAQSQKDAREHQLVVDAMVAALEPLCSKLEVLPEPRPRRAGRAVHLETPITGTLRSGVDVLTVAQRLHPTPALGGWPREVAQQTIAAREGIDRGWYGGALGWLAPNGDGMLAVTIRCALIRGACAHAFAGAGIVAGSEAEREWQETELKLAGVRESLQLTREDAA